MYMRMSARDISLVAMFAALAAVAATMSRFFTMVIPYSQIPFSLVPMVVLLAGMLLGARLGALSMTVYMLMGLLGLPVFENAPFGGMAYFLKPSFGFLPGFILGAYVTGKLAPPKGDAGPGRALAASLAGVAAIYAVGLPYLYLALNYLMGKSSTVFAVLKIGFIPFIIPDLIKAVLVSFLAPALGRRMKKGEAGE
ncbi:MAG: biotin transporter BioY [Bacillota bacterium]